MVTIEERNREPRSEGLFAAGGSILEAFERRVSTAPHAMALACEGEQLTYRELKDRVDSLADALSHEYGVQPGEIVALLLRESTSAIISMLATLKVGAAYLPIDPSLPENRVRELVQDAGCRTALISERAASSAQGMNVRLAPVEQHLNRSPRGVSSAPRATGDGAIAYVMYTSGSTGKPKGVMVSHRAILNLCDVIRQEVYERHAGKLRVALVASLTFDSSVKQIYPALLNGHCLVLMDREYKRDPAEFVRFLNEQRVDVCDITPTLLGLLVFAMSDSPLRLDGLREFLVGGEALSAALVQKFMRGASTRNVKVANLYGVTECCVDSTIYHCSEADLSGVKVVPIGRVLPNMQVYIMDEQQRPLPTGQEGEICIAGAGLAVGYWNDPELTRQKFVVDREGRRLYRTGDVGRQLPNGVFEFIGRRDRQVKIRGHRVELGEVESTLVRMADVDSAALIAASGEQDALALVAFVVAKERLDCGRLLRRCREFLPDYMLPTQIVQIDGLPLTAHGKVDYARLATQVVAGAGAQASGTAAERTLDEQLLAICGELLSPSEGVSLQDNFFELGGVSLDVIKFVTRVNMSFDVGLKIKDIYQTPVLRDISRKIAMQKQRAVEGLGGRALGLGRKLFRGAFVRGSS